MHACAPTRSQSAPKSKGRVNPWRGEPRQGPRGHDSYVLQRALLIAEFSCRLQAIEIRLKRRVERMAVDTNDVQKGIRSNAAVAGIGNSGADQPDRPSVLPAGVFVVFRCARRVGRILTREPGNRVCVLRRALQEVELLARLDYRRSIQTQAVLLSQSGQHLAALGGLT